MQGKWISTQRWQGSPRNLDHGMRSKGFDAKCWLGLQVKEWPQFRHRRAPVTKSWNVLKRLGQQYQSGIIVRGLEQLPADRDAGKCLKLATFLWPSCTQFICAQLCNAPQFSRVDYIHSVIFRYSQYFTIKYIHMFVGSHALAPA
jgi:hypothetical protein